MEKELCEYYENVSALTRGEVFDAFEKRVRADLNSLLIVPNDCFCEELNLSTVNLELKGEVSLPD